MSDEAIKRKLVIVGDGACGKTSLLCVFTLGEFPKEYHPTVFENYVTDVRVDGKLVELALWDTAGQEEYERLRPMMYANAHVILIGFSINQPYSLENAETKWIDEVREKGGQAEIFLVGLKMDLRDDPAAIAEMRASNSRFVTRADGELAARQMGVRRYLECSALTGEGVDNVFEHATRASLLRPDKEPRCSCVIL